MKKAIKVFWYRCTECDYEVASSGRVKCSQCDCLMTRVARAGAVLKQNNSK